MRHRILGISENRLQKLLNIAPVSIIFFVVAVFIVSIIFLSFFNHPSADDYCFGYRFQKDGFLNYQKTLYYSWSGRYSANFVLGLAFISDIFGFNYWNLIFKAGPILILSLFVAMLILLVKSLNLKSLRQSFLILGIFCLLNFNLLISISEGYYWMSSSLVYGLSISFLLLILSSILSLYTFENSRLTLILRIVICLFSVITVGMHEVVMTYIFLVFLLLTILSLIKKNKYRFFYLFNFILIVLFIFVELSAGGNYVRMLYFPNAGNFAFSLKHAIQSFFIISASIFTNPIFWLCSFVYIMSLKSLIRPKPLSKLPNPFIFLLISIAFISSLYFPSFWGTGGPPPYRALNVITTIFILHWLVFLAAIFKTSYKKLGPFLELRLSKVMVLLASIGIVIFSLASHGNLKLVLSDLTSGSAQKYNQELESRDSLVRSSKRTNKLNLILNQLSAKPYSLFFSDIEQNADDWKNICFSNYYGLETAKIQ